MTQPPRLTRAELAQQLYSELVSFIRERAAGKEELIASTPALATAYGRLVNATLAEVSLAAHLGYLNWDNYLKGVLLQPLAGVGVELSVDDETFLREVLSALTDILAKNA